MSESCSSQQSLESTMAMRSCDTAQQLKNNGTHSRACRGRVLSRLVDFRFLPRLPRPRGRTVSCLHAEVFTTEAGKANSLDAFGSDTPK